MFQKLSLQACNNRVRNGQGVMSRLNGNAEMDFLHLCSVPASEPCVQAGNNIEHQLLECIVFGNQLIRIYGNPPEGAEIVIIRQVHDDAGVYNELGIFYQVTEEEAENITDSEEYAFKLEGGLPEKWDEEALKELEANNYILLKPMPEIEAWTPRKIIKLKQA